MKVDPESPSYDRNQSDKKDINGNTIMLTESSLAVDDLDSTDDLATTKTPNAALAMSNK